MGFNASSLFSMIPSRDYLQFWQSGRFHPQRVVRFLRLTKAEVVRLAEVAPSSVRFDRKIPRILSDRLSEVAATCTLVAEFFEGNVTKTALWFKTLNPMLGDISPRDMIAHGHHEKLRRFVVSALAENDAHIATAKAYGAPQQREVNPAERFLGPHLQAIAELCERYGVQRLAAFGSVLRADFDPARSDIDLAVEFAPDSKGSPARQYFDFKSALEALLRRPVDLVELSAMPDSRLKRLIGRTQVPVYAQAA
jgi:predicted nucleotidyltransferase